MPLIKSYRDTHPSWGKDVFLAENITLVGDITLGDEVNIWYGSVLRGDVGKITIESRANLQDLCCVHMTKHISNAHICELASIGHSAIIHGALIESKALIGMQAVVMDNARIGEQSIVGAGALVTSNTVIPPRSLVLGSPAKVVRTLSDEECQAGEKTALRYLGLAQEHRAEASR